MRNITRRKFMGDIARIGGFGLGLGASAYGRGLYGRTGNNILSDIPIKDYNIFCFTADTINPFHLGYNKYPRDTSPNLDKLAEMSFNFTNAYSPTGWTKPSYVTLVTGQYPVTHKVVFREAKIPKTTVTMTQMFKKVGYKTRFITEAGTHLVNANFSQGCDDFIPFPNRYSTEKFDGIISWIEKNKNDKMYLFLHTFDPHVPYDPPAPYYKRYLSDPYYELGRPIPPFVKGKKVYNSEGVRQQIFPLDNGCGVLQNIIDTTPGWKYSGYWRALYDGTVKFTDEQIGRLIECLKKNGLMENSIIIFTSDHGETMDEHDFFFNHGNPYEQVMKIPLLIYIPGTTPVKIDSYVGLEDIFPTLCELNQLPVLDSVDGKSLLPLLTGEKDRVREIAFAQGSYWTMAKTYIRNNEYKLVLPGGAIEFKTIDREYLFNLRRDPGESENMYEKLKDKEPFRRLVKEINAYKNGEYSIKEADEPELLILTDEMREKLETFGYID